MADSLRHRGPDEAGAWVDAEAGIALSHRRLEVVGLGWQGHQPMSSHSGRWVVTYNGELYNAGELRAQLTASGRGVLGSSDTEVLVEGLDRWGLSGCLDRVEGMFAFAAWDRTTRRLHLVRDRFGEKPLYYGWVGGRLAFASELKGFHRLPGFRAQVDPEAVTRYLTSSCVPAPHCIFLGLAKLAPGSCVAFDAGAPPGVLRPQVAYWSARSAIDRARRQPPLSDPGELADTVEAALSASVAGRLVADVPVGALLSGGIDSSLVVALMQRHTSQRVRTFTVAFVEEAFDESATAAAVAAHLGTEHTVVDMTQQDLLERIPRLPDVWDEPFGDSSQLPTLLVAEAAARRVRVALSGDGGDELFAGYNRHAWLGRIWHRAGALPPPVRRSLGRALRTVPPGAVDAVGGALPARWRVRLPSVKVDKVGRVLQAPTLGHAYAALLAHWDDPSSLVLGAGSSGAAPSPSDDWADGAPTGDVTDQLLRSDLTSYLPDDVLTKVDRAAMAASLETRTPFLDRGVLDVAWRIPADWKIHEGTTKWALRSVLDRHVPRDLVDGPKMGFGVPLDAWLRGPLRPWAEDLLSEEAVKRHGLLDPFPVRRAWRQHLAGHRDRGYELWDVLMLQAFMDRWSAGAASSSVSAAEAQGVS
jgi:asparagine synthase (glutamine-hydrolysing)